MLVNTMKSSLLHEHLITILIMTLVSVIRDSNKSFNRAKEFHNIYKVFGNSGINKRVASEPKCGAIHATLMINLESIFYGRYEIMKINYQSS